MSGQKVLPLYWLARMVRGLEEEDLEGLSEQEEQEFWEDVTEKDLEDPEPWPVLVSGIGGNTLCFFSAEERVWEMADRFYKVNLVHSITGDPITMDDLEVRRSGDVGTLLALCDKAENEHAVTSGIIDPPPEFFEPYSAYSAPSLSEIRERIRRKGEECAW